MSERVREWLWILGGVAVTYTTYWLRYGHLPGRWSWDMVWPGLLFVVVAAIIDVRVWRR